MLRMTEKQPKKGLEAGVDFDMMTSVYATHLPELIKEPAFAELLDEAVWRILELKINWDF